MAADCCPTPTRSLTLTPTPTPTPTRARVRTLSPMRGFTAGLGFGFGILNPPVNGGLQAADTGWARPSIAWENTGFGTGFDLFAELGIPFWAARESWIGMDFDFSAGYEMDLSYTNSLAFILENQTYIPVADNKPASPDGAVVYAAAAQEVSSWFIPGIKFTQELGGVGSLYAELDIPFNAAGREYPFSLIGLDFHIIMDTKLGFGLESCVKNAIKNTDGEAGFFDYLYLTPYYIFGPFYASFGVGIPTYKDGMDKAGLSLTPGIQYTIMNGLTASLTLLVNQLKRSLDPPAFGMSAGVNYSF